MRIKSAQSTFLSGKKDNATYKNVPKTTINLSGSTPDTPPRFRYIELFAGIGGFRVSLDAIPGGTSVFASEIGDAARFTYISNFGNETVLEKEGGEENDLLVGDITEVETVDIPDHDILTAGFPCQSFCKVGGRQALNDERGELFFEVVRVLKGKKPKAFILENVANLVTMEEGRVFGIIKGHLNAAGYNVQYQIIDASAYTPQVRKRVYIIGFLDKSHSLRFAFPTPPTSSPSLRDVLFPDPPPASLLLTPHQFSKLKNSWTWQKNPVWRVANVGIKKNGKARTLMSSYKSGFVMYSEFVPVPLPSECDEDHEDDGDVGEEDHEFTSALEEAVARDAGGGSGGDSENQTDVEEHEQPSKRLKAGSLTVEPDKYKSLRFRFASINFRQKVTREAERGEYLKNKGRNGKGGDWWGNVETKFETSSCYNDSFKEHNYKLLRSITYADPKSKPAATAPSQSSDAASQQEFDKVFQKQWSKYRMRKPPKDDFGTHYDILTGRELGQAPPGVHIPGRRAGRVSIDKLNALKYGSEGGEHKRNYNIISNAPLSAALKE
ncbi:UNVERIFIED_CONTAM: hypothetical protein HDU68_010587 [Siphonaria sp. JEL0065]|nr:hypothetical protein HDU68_010587 [Siphonaria sp. JEL0065]